MTNPTIGQAVRLAAEAMAADGPSPLTDAVRDAITSEELRFLGLAMCARYDASVDGDYSLGRPQCSQVMQRLADAIDWRHA